MLLCDFYAAKQISRSQNAQCFAEKCRSIEFQCPKTDSYTAITSRSGSTSCFNIPSIAINVPVKELGQLPQAP